MTGKSLGYGISLFLLCAQPSVAKYSVKYSSNSPQERAEDRKRNQQLYEVYGDVVMTNCLLQLYFGNQEQAIEEYRDFMNLSVRQVLLDFDAPEFSVIEKDGYFFFEEKGKNDSDLRDPIFDLENYINGKSEQDSKVHVPSYEKKKLIERIHKTVEYRRSKSWFLTDVWNWLNRILKKKPRLHSH